MTKPLGPHQRAILFSIWIFLLSYFLPAAAQSMSPTGLCAVGQIGECLISFEWRNLAWAILCSAVGGLSRTVFTLLSPNEVVHSVTREGWKDILISSVLGSFAYAAILAYNVVEQLPNVPTWTTVFILVVVGWSRTAALIWFEKAGTKLANGSIDAVLNRIGGRSGYAYAPDAPNDYVRPAKRQMVDNPDEVRDEHQ